MISGAHSRGRGCWLSPVSITSFLEFQKFPCSAEHTATPAGAESPVPARRVPSQGTLRRWVLPAPPLLSCLMGPAPP